MISNIIAYIILIFLFFLISLFIYYIFDFGLLTLDLCIDLLFMFFCACFVTLLNYFIRKLIHKHKDGDDNE